MMPCTRGARTFKFRALPGSEEILALAAASSAASASISTSASAISAAPSTAVAAGRSSATAGRGGHGSCFVNYQRPAQKVLSVTSTDRFICLVILFDFCKSETSGFTGKPVANDAYSAHVDAGGSEPRLQVRFVRLVGEVSYE